MKITVDESHLYEEPEVILKCRELDAPLRRIIAAIRLANGKLLGRQDTVSHVIDAEEVFYFESVDNKVFIYTEKQVYETSLRLYEMDTNNQKDGRTVSPYLVKCAVTGIVATRNGWYNNRRRGVQDEEIRCRIQEKNSAVLFGKQTNRTKPGG